MHISRTSYSRCASQPLALGSTVFAILAVVACGADGTVRFVDYDSTCASDDDCVVVQELWDCTMRCPPASINRNAKDEYEADLKEARAACDSVTEATCSGSFVNRCITDKCVAFETPVDAGTD